MAEPTPIPTDHLTMEAPIDVVTLSAEAAPFGDQYAFDTGLGFFTSIGSSERGLFSRPAIDRGISARAGWTATSETKTQTRKNRLLIPGTFRSIFYRLPHLSKLLA